MWIFLFNSVGEKCWETKSWNLLSFSQTFVGWEDCTGNCVDVWVIGLNVNNSACQGPASFGLCHSRSRSPQFQFATVNTMTPAFCAVVRNWAIPWKEISIIVFAFLFFLFSFITIVCASKTVATETVHTVLTEFNHQLHCNLSSSAALCNSKAKVLSFWVFFEVLWRNLMMEVRLVWIKQTAALLKLALWS